ncbi:MAG: M20/M25/M40 family metallo-hydrolase [Candidatus Hodarchaeota archaeon]
MNLDKEIVLNRFDMFKNDTDIAKETIEFLQAIIKYDTSNPPGNELELAKYLQERFEKEKISFMKTKVIETTPNRGNLVVTIEGSDPANNKSYGFATHLDVVPVDEKEWKYPPFSGELVKDEHDSFIWGRGTMDTKGHLVSMAMAIITLLREGFRPKGTIKLIFEADEEVGGHQGMEKLVAEYWEDVKVDYFLTEGGGFKVPFGDDIVINIGEKGKAQTKLIAKGVSGHGSMPDPYDEFAMYKLVKILEKIRTRNIKIYMGDEYKEFVKSISLPGIFRFLMGRKSIIKGLAKLVKAITKQDLGKVLIPMISDTISPTIIKGGSKENVISPTCELTLDIRTLPGHDREFINKRLEEIIGKKLFSEIEVAPVDDMPASTAPIGSEFYNQIGEVLDDIYPGGNLLPILGMGATDMRYFRPKGVPSYGFTPLLKDKDLSWSDLTSLAHAPNERLSVTNLMIATDFFYRLMKRV